MAAPRAILLDLGDTLAYQDPPGDEVLQRWLIERGIAVDLADVRRARLAATSRYYVLALARSHLGVNESKGPLVDEFDRTLLSSLGLGDRTDVSAAGIQAAFRGLERRLRLFGDAAATLAALRARGVRLAIVSNWDHGLVERCRELGLLDLLDAVVGSAATGYEKPDPAIFDLALRRLGVVAGDAWHVGDLYAIDVLGSRAAGIRPILLDRHGLLENVDCASVRSLLELPRLFDEERDHESGRDGD